MTFKTTAALVLAAFAIAAAPPALAKTSLSKAQKICEDTLKSADPAPASVRTERDSTLVSDAAVTFTIRVKNADDSSSKITCTVDRETDAPSITVS